MSTLDVRARLGDLLNRVALRHDEFIIERKGQPLAALVPVERLEQIRRLAREHAAGFLEQQRRKTKSDLTDRAAMELALEAQRTARRKLQGPKAPAKRTRKRK